MTAAPLPGFKKSAQRAGVRLVGAQLNRINARRAKQFQQLGLRSGLALGEGNALPFIRRVHLDDFTRLRVLQNQPAERGQLQLEAVGDLDGDQVVAAIGLAQDSERRLAERFRQDGLAPQMRVDFRTGRRRLTKKIRQNDHNGPMGGDLEQKFQRAVQVGPASRWRVEENFANDAQDVLPAFARRNEFFHAFGEKNKTDLVVVADGG